MNFIIIHGVYSGPDANWFPWLKSELEKQGHEVIVPKFPTPLNQSLESWLRAISPYEGKINEETVLVGHSLGAAFILSYLEQAGKKVKAAFLVVGFHKLLNSPYDEINKTFVDRGFGWDKIRNNCQKFFVFCSDNDKYIPLEVSKELAQSLNAELNVVAGGGHLNKESGYDEFPLLLDTILVELD